MRPIVIALQTMTLVVCCAFSPLAFSHTHGEAQAQMSLNEGSLNLELTLPMEILVGFERAPRSENEKQRWNQALTDLSQTDALWRMPASAACKAQAPKTTLPSWGKSEHTDVVITYLWQCERPQALDQLQTQLFERFKRLRRIEFVHVTAKGQGMTKLTPQKPIWTTGSAK